MFVPMLRDRQKLLNVLHRIYWDMYRLCVLDETKGQTRRPLPLLPLAMAQLAPMNQHALVPGPRLAEEAPYITVRGVTPTVVVVLR